MLPDRDRVLQTPQMPPMVIPVAMSVMPPPHAPRASLIQHPCPLGEGQTQNSPESWGSLWNVVFAKVLNLEDFSRQTSPAGGREAGLDTRGSG